MMEQLLIYRERFLKLLVSKGKYIQFLGRFLGGIILFYVVNQTYGQIHLLGQPFMILIMGLICVFVPTSVIFIMYHLIVLLNLFSISIEIAIVYLVLIGLYILIYQRMFVKQEILFLMTIGAFYFHIPAIMPLITGVFAGLIGLPAILMGGFFYYFAIVIQESLLQVGNGTVNAHLYNLVLQGTTRNKELLLCLFVFVLVAAVVAGIRKLQASYGWYIAIFAGGVVYMLVMLIGGYFVNSDVNIISEILMILLCIAIVMLGQFLYNVIDYTREENFEFEDEEYYYYVKAIPKISVAEEEFNVTQITVPARRFNLKRKEKQEHDEGEKS